MSSRRQSTSVSVMRPPKPPSWRDFIASEVSNKPQSTVAVVSSKVENYPPNPACRVLETKSTTHLHNVSELPRPSITSLSTAALPGRSARQGRQRPRAKIHRTRSEHGILTHDLPRDSLPPILKISTSSRIGTHDIHPSSTLQQNQETLGGCRVSLDINRRCQSWLASIEACEPLDEVSYSSSSPIPSPIATAVVYNKNQRNYGGFNPFPIPVHALGEDVDVEIPDEMFVWPRERRSSSPVSREESFPPLPDKSRGVKRDKSNAGPTKHSISRSGSHKDTAIPIVTQALPSGDSGHTMRFSNFHKNDKLDEVMKQNSKKSSSKRCCDVISFNCYRRKEVHSDT